MPDVRPFRGVRYDMARVGALADWFAALGGAKINVTAVSAITAGAGRFGAVLWVKARDVKRAAKALGVG